MTDLQSLPPAPGLRRAAWTSVLERDLDLALLDLLHTSPAFRRWLLSAVAPDVADVDPDDGFLGAWHSVNTPNGESDLEAEWRREDGTRLTVLVEDKLGSAFQPEQGLRYRERAAAYGASGRAGITRVVLIAPSGYPARDPAGAAPFERHLSVEEVLAWCEAGGAGDRSRHLAAFLRHALDRTGGRARGYAMEAGAGAPLGGGGKPQYPEFYAHLRAVLETRAAAVGGVTGLTNSSPGEWVYFDFPGKPGSGASLRWRLRDHWVELVLADAKVRRVDLEAALLHEPLAGAAVTGRGSSEVVVWVPVAEVDAAAPTEPQQLAVEQAVSAANELARWYAATRTRYE